eukprot:GDKJ01049258.1.p1 GENE.GDKJ01049258.1~~GDKJ01049258.1.p1  ORF type:complete len:1841 (+),score=453.35 GDKJ01049258.1:865-6387(+)
MNSPVEGNATPLTTNNNNNTQKLLSPPFNNGKSKSVSNSTFGENNAFGLTNSNTDLNLSSRNCNNILRNSAHLHPGISCSQRQNAPQPSTANALAMNNNNNNNSNLSSLSPTGLVLTRVRLSTYMASQSFSEIHKSLNFGADCEMLVRTLANEWDKLAECQKDVAKCAVLQFFAALYLKTQRNQDGSCPTTYFLWMAATSLVLFKDAEIAQIGLKIASEGTSMPFDAAYLCYLLQKSCEDLRNNAVLLKRTTGVSDMAAYRRWSSSARNLHEKALNGMKKFFKSSSLMSNLSKVSSCESYRYYTSSENKAILDAKGLLKDSLQALRQAEDAYDALLIRYPNVPSVLQMVTMFKRQFFREMEHSKHDTNIANANSGLLQSSNVANNPGAMIENQSANNSNRGALVTLNARGTNGSAFDSQGNPNFESEPNTTEIQDDNTSYCTSLGSGLTETPKQVQLTFLNDALLRSFKKVRIWSFAAVGFVVAIATVLLIVGILQLTQVKDWLNVFFTMESVFDDVARLCAFGLRPLVGAKFIGQTFFGVADYIINLPVDYDSDPLTPSVNMQTLLEDDGASGLNSAVMMGRNRQFCRTLLTRIADAEFCSILYLTETSRNIVELYDVKTGEFSAGETLFADYANPLTSDRKEFFKFYSETLAAAENRTITFPTRTTPKNLLIRRDAEDWFELKSSSRALFYWSSGSASHSNPNETPLQAVLTIAAKMVPNDFYTSKFLEDIDEMTKSVVSYANQFEKEVMRLNIESVKSVMESADFFEFDYFSYNGTMTAKGTKLNYMEGVNYLASVTNTVADIIRKWYYVDLMASPVQTLVSFCAGDNTGRPERLLNAFYDHLVSTVDRSKTIVILCACGAVAVGVIGAALTVGLIRMFLSPFDRSDRVSPTLAIVASFPKNEIRKIAKAFSLLKIDRGIFDPDDERAGVMDLTVSRKTQKMQDAIFKSNQGAVLRVRELEFDFASENECTTKIFNVNNYNNSSNHNNDNNGNNGNIRNSSINETQNMNSCEGDNCNVPTASSMKRSINSPLNDERIAVESQNFKVPNVDQVQINRKNENFRRKHDIKKNNINNNSNIMNNTHQQLSFFSHRSPFSSDQKKKLIHLFSSTSLASPSDNLIINSANANELPADSANSLSNNQDILKSNINNNENSLAGRRESGDHQFRSPFTSNNRPPPPIDHVASIFSDLSNNEDSNDFQVEEVVGFLPSSSPNNPLAFSSPNVVNNNLNNDDNTNDNNNQNNQNCSIPISNSSSFVTPETDEDFNQASHVNYTNNIKMNANSSSIHGVTSPSQSHQPQEVKFPDFHSASRDIAVNRRNNINHYHYNNSNTNNNSMKKNNIDTNLNIRPSPFFDENQEEDYVDEDDADNQQQGLYMVKNNNSNSLRDHTNSVSFSFNKNVSKIENSLNMKKNKNVTHSYNNSEFIKNIRVKKNVSPSRVHHHDVHFHDISSSTPPSSQNKLTTLKHHKKNRNHNLRDNGEYFEAEPQHSSHLSLPHSANTPSLMFDGIDDASTNVSSSKKTSSGTPSISSGVFRYLRAVLWQRPVTRGFLIVWAVMMAYLTMTLVVCVLSVSRYNFYYDVSVNILKSSFNLSLGGLNVGFVLSGDLPYTSSHLPDWTSAALVHLERGNELFSNVIQRPVSGSQTSLARFYNNIENLVYVPNCLPDELERVSPSYDSWGCGTERQGQIAYDYPLKDNMVFGLARAVLFFYDFSKKALDKAASSPPVALLSAADFDVWFQSDALRDDISPGFSALNAMFKQHALTSVDADTLTQYLLLGGGILAGVLCAIAFECIIFEHRNNFKDCLLLLRIIPSRLNEDYRIVEKVLSVKMDEDDAIL